MEPKPRKDALQAWVRALAAIKILDEKPEATLPVILQDLAGLYGANAALIGAHEQLSYREAAERANQYAGWALAQGLAAGDVVCLLLPNCPDYVAIWLGLTQVGCVAALLNTNLTGSALLHSIRAAKAAHIICAAGLLKPLRELDGSLAADTRIWVHGESSGADVSRIDTQISHYAKGAPEIAPERRPKGRDIALLIYTSGTTGLPKAANVTHGRLVEWSYWFAGMMDAKASDRLYNCLPLYHSTGGVVAVGAMLVSGGCVVIRERFSVSRFWDDIIAERCTIFQYIGELCRYLAHSPPHPRETEHQLRLCCGNGLRGDVWEGFAQRFRIPKILEFYAATEGNVSLYNCEGKPGAIGRVPAFLAHRFPVALIKGDTASGDPLRGENGFCVRCAPDEAGEAIGKILTTKQSQFDGYTDTSASAAKLLHNVFEDGDLWFRTGDLMRKDAAGYYYFVDRLGDTFRWKGENISATEVATVAGGCPGVTEAVVFGVTVPGHEGRAGMAAITVNEIFTWQILQSHLAARLPDYARPLFVRICASLERTGTFKQKKDKLQLEGFATPSDQDAVWFYDRTRQAFVSCDAALTQHIMSGRVTRV